jgi:hypothetical protein
MARDEPAGKKAHIIEVGYARDCDVERKRAQKAAQHGRLTDALHGLLQVFLQISRAFHLH